MRREYITEPSDLTQALIQMGLSKQTARGQQAKSIIDALARLTEDEKQNLVALRLDDLYHEAKELVEKMNDMYTKYDKLAGITDQLSNERCKDALILWREMMGYYLNYADHRDPAQGAKAISYILYAVFGGQARNNASASSTDIDVWSVVDEGKTS